MGFRMHCSAVVLGALLAVACGPSGARGGADDARATAPVAPREAAAPHAAVPPPGPQDSARARARVAARRDSVSAAFARATALGAREVAELRQDRNAEHVATARRLGVRAAGEAEIQQLLREGRLVALGDSTPYWILREMDHSVPLVTPDARAMLEHLGRRFQSRLVALGLPAYRMKVTSALRTDDTQADLRRINSYASSTASAHEFGTTVDVSHERFASPAAVGMLGELETDMLNEVGAQHAKALQAELGRAIAQMRAEGALHVMMENRQPVYHMTVARREAAAAR